MFRGLEFEFDLSVPAGSVQADSLNAQADAEIREKYQFSAGHYL